MIYEDFLTWFINFSNKIGTDLPLNRHELFQEDDMKNIRDLIDSAVIDNGVKGGLRWSLGKATSGDKFSVCGSWHTKTKTYVNPSMKLKVRDADRFNFTTSIGESSREIVVKLKKLASDLKVSLKLSQKML